ncbi:MAG: GIY-YIG nuclease family protein [Rickettsiales bacterium]|nr:GIY-YIG nuclease family protein [Pseudomonadota bacterium]MDA0966531.1 GIY-YIG nuclease family protein [Pseudomonadota bacterium]MDG4543393.1 GIY-YIG nuclease family protein [Rickettsiales bacterium]MDG4545659.1 GIY-YIG nuclease family protein [Rickettsiales bacterium]MDG4548108.1 GIY-YIG nuclease family protein [Rickettsiales bacterium]
MLSKTQVKTVTATGISMTKYVMEVYPIGTQFNNVSGVYCFINNNNTPIYIGETDNLNRRLNLEIQNHQQWQCIKKNGSTHVAVMLVNGYKQQRLDIETDIRQNYNTACNMQ